MNNDPQRPRDWLLARHAGQEAQLDALRRAALPAPALSWPEALREIFRPHRRLWQALGAAWLLMAVFHFTSSPGPRRVNPAGPPPEAVALWFAQFSSHETLARNHHSR
jgi:hypothetical protein